MHVEDIQFYMSILAFITKRPFYKEEPLDKETKSNKHVWKPANRCTSEVAVTTLRSTCDLSEADRGEEVDL